MNTRSVRFEYSINMSNINVDCSIILKVTNPHHFTAWRIHTLPAGSREKVFSVPCWLCFLALNTCSGLGCKYSSLGAYHLNWKSFLFVPLLGSISMCYAEWDCPMWESHLQLFTIRCSVFGRQTKSTIIYPALVFGVTSMQEGAGILRNLHKHLSLQEHACYCVLCWIIAYFLPHPRELCWWGEGWIQDPTSS